MNHPKRRNEENSVDVEEIATTCISRVSRVSRVSADELLQLIAGQTVVLVVDPDPNKWSVTGSLQGDAVTLQDLQSMEETTWL